jgi:hypothetical protein
MAVNQLSRWNVSGKTVTAVSAECLGSACRDLLLAGKDLRRAAVAIAEAVLKRTEESGTRTAITTPQYILEEAVNEPSLSHNYVSPTKISITSLRMSSKVFPAKVRFTHKTM